MKILMLLILFLLTGAFFIISNENIQLNSQENLNIFFKSYTIWLDSLIDNTQTVSGYMVKMEWLPNDGKVS